MLKYTKEELEEKIKEQEKNINLKSVEYSDYSEKINHINKYFRLKDNFIQFRDTAFISMFSGTIFIVISLFNSIRMANVFSISLGLIGFVEYFISGLCLDKISKIKKELKNYYNDISDVNDNDLDEELFLLERAKIKNSNELFNIKQELIGLKKYKEIIDNNNFDDYINEKIDYSNVYFDNNIGKSIEYTENNKKLIKKR